MSHSEPVTDVIFRVFPEGAVIAMFPAVPAGLRESYACMSYMRVGQHAAASLCLSQRTRSAKPEQYASLARELESIGYRLRIVKRRTRKHDAARREACAPSQRDAGALPDASASALPEHSTAAMQGGAI